jgi:acetate kinase
MKILVLNSGSSSQKACLYDLNAAPPDAAPQPAWEGKMEWRETAATLAVRTPAKTFAPRTLDRRDRSAATAQLLDELTSGETRVLQSFSEINIVGHRIVNGGRKYNRPTLVDREVKKAIEEMAIFAPLHNRVELEGIALIEKLGGAVPQVAVFDTSFHSNLADAAAIYPGPYDWVQRGIRKFGFHGINHQYCAERAARMLGKDLGALKLISCHLGNGCSLAAIAAGRSIDTTMGFTPLDGLMMGTRSGSVDPGILTYLMRAEHLDGEALDSILNAKSGLLGISGLSSDMREILDSAGKGNQRAKLAFDIFIHRLRAEMGAMLAALNGVDAFVFTAGIGEHAREVREAACSHFAFLGAALDRDKNETATGDADIATLASPVRILVVAAQEDWAIARECWKFASA